MNREIKFRVWDNTNKVMNNDRQKYHEFITELTKDHCKIMQFTGLKDNNAKEIYEGDIIEYIYGNSNVFKSEVIWIDHIEKGDLDNDQRHVGFMLRFCDGDITDFPFLVSIEIIGNIHENPNLLES